MAAFMAAPETQRCDGVVLNYRGDVIERLQRDLVTQKSVEAGVVLDH